jgi:hypothetical protein
MMAAAVIIAAVIAVMIVAVIAADMTAGMVDERVCAFCLSKMMPTCSVS